MAQLSVGAFVCFHMIAIVALPFITITITVYFREVSFSVLYWGCNYNGQHQLGLGSIDGL